MQVPPGPPSLPRGVIVAQLALDQLERVRVLPRQPVLSSMLTKLIIVSACAVLLAATCPAQAPSHVVAAVICAEARGEGEAGMQAVYEVMWTRAIEHRKTLLGEVTHPKWYTSLNRTTPADLVRRMSKTPQWNFAVSLVSGPPKTKLARGSNHYTKASESPSWARGHRPVVVLGRHAFYRLN